MIQRQKGSARLGKSALIYCDRAAKLGMTGGNKTDVEVVQRPKASVTELFIRARPFGGDPTVTTGDI